MFYRVGKCPQSNRIRFALCLLSGLAIGQDPRELRYLGNPAPVALFFKLDFHSVHYSTEALQKALEGFGGG